MNYCLYDNRLSVTEQLQILINKGWYSSIQNIVGDGTKLLAEIDRHKFDSSEDFYVSEEYVYEFYEEPEDPEGYVKYDDIFYLMMEEEPEETEERVKYDDILFLMIEFGYVDIVKKLLEKGVRLGARKYFLSEGWSMAYDLMYRGFYYTETDYSKWGELEEELNKTVAPEWKQRRALIIDLLEQYGEIDKEIDLTKLILFCNDQYPKNDIQMGDEFAVDNVLNEMAQFESLFYDTTDAQNHINSNIMPDDLYDVFNVYFLDCMIRWGEIRILEKLFEMHVYINKSKEVEEKIGDMCRLITYYNKSGLKYLKSKEKILEYRKQLFYLLEWNLEIPEILAVQQNMIDRLTSGYYTGDISSGNELFIYLLDETAKFHEEWLNEYICEVNNLDMFLQLLERGAKVNYKSDKMLIRAIESVDVALFNYIIEHGHYSLEQLEEYKEYVRNKDIFEELITRGINFSKEELLNTYLYFDEEWCSDTEEIFKSYLLSKIYG